jgi:hypothetical protein
MDSKIPTTDEGNDPGENNPADHHIKSQVLPQHSQNTPGISSTNTADDTAGCCGAPENSELQDEILSDGSASAFEGTESIVDSDSEAKKTRKRAPEDASGVSNY